MHLVLVFLATALCCFACADPAMVMSDYLAGAVVKGATRLSTGEPVVGAAVQLEVHQSTCDQRAVTAYGSVFTAIDGTFEGEFTFMTRTGPVVAHCLKIQVVDTSSSVLIGDTVLARSLLFDATKSDTLEVDLVF